jgi:tellurium resistance protein TerD
MTTTLMVEKGDTIKLAVDKGGDTKVTIGCGWSPRSAAGKPPFDLDSWMILLGENNKAVNTAGVPYGIVFYGNPEIKEFLGTKDSDGNDQFHLVAKDGSVIHYGDNRTGDGAGDDEVIEVFLSKVDPEVKKILIAASIYHGKKEGLTFNMVDDAYVHIDVPGDRDYKCFVGEEESCKKAHTVILGQLYRDPSDPTGWKFKYVMEGFEDELIEVGIAHGVPLG